MARFMEKRVFDFTLREILRNVSQDLKITLKTGDIVIVQGLGSRAEWPLGRVEETYPDEEDAVRMMKVGLQTKTGQFFEL